MSVRRSEVCSSVLASYGSETTVGSLADYYLRIHCGIEVCAFSHTNLIVSPSSIFNTSSRTDQDNWVRWKFQHSPWRPSTRTCWAPVRGKVLWIRISTFVSYTRSRKTRSNMLKNPFHLYMSPHCPTDLYLLKIEHKSIRESSTIWIVMDHGLGDWCNAQTKWFHTKKDLGSYWTKNSTSMRNIQRL